MNSTPAPIKASRPYVVVDAGAMQLAFNTLERASKVEILQEVRTATTSARVVEVTPDELESLQIVITLFSMFSSKVEIRDLLTSLAEKLHGDQPILVVRSSE